jgi:DNA-directed RNA polymerase
VNIAQKTAWRINRRIYDVLIKAWEMSAFDNLLPRADDYELPEKPADIATNEEARKAYRRRAAAIHTKNAQLRPKRLLFLKLLWLADKFKDEPRFYFPYQLDFRGRIYPIPAFLTPQGNDVARALLEFAVGKPLGNARGVGWLAIHGANCFGIDKVSFEDRISWVYEHEEEILASAADPFSCGFWQTADDPFQFLAFCFEWEGYNREGVDYVSHIPVMLDGSCNGLQHYSALLRDYRGGKATNLVPAARPADIYSEVAAVARKRLEEEAAQSVCVPLDPDVEKRVRFARTWLKLGIDRKTTKRSVMTLPYGATFYACKEYVMDWADEAGHEAAFGADYVAACDYLAGVVWKSIGDVVVAAREAMEWLRSVARIMAKYGLPMQWTTPNGFRVFQAYFEDRYRRVKTKLGETLIWAVIPSFDNAKVSWRKQVNGIAPNFVHSLDATALQDYVLLASANGVNNFALVHDCYGTLAADTDMSVACLREAFVSLYETNDPLASLLEEVKAALPEEAHAELPPLPTRGALDISAVRESPYFFA